MIKANINNIYSFLPPGVDQFGFQIVRNTEYAKYLAEIVGAEYSGMISTNTRLPSDSYLFSFCPVTVEQYDQLQIDPTRLWGGMVKFSFPLKGIIHPLVKDTQSVPANFPREFSEKLYEQHLSVPGITCFSKKDIRRAYFDLSKDGFIVRLKDSHGSGTVKQYRLENLARLEEILFGYQDGYIERSGMLVELNIVDPEGSALPDSYSIGVLEILGNVYSYIGHQKIVDSGLFGYLGTRLSLYNGGFKEEISSHGLYQIIEKKANSMIQLITEYKPFRVGSRLNADLIYGVFEREDLQETISQKPEMYFTEISTYPGGATAGELVAVRYLNENPNKRSITIDSLTDHAYTGLYDRDYVKIFCDTVDPILGHTRVGAVIVDE
ncbi:DUF3182 family protein [Candidatus Nomurabacteria bacterium]|nr:DUF3182 family protein [Candidatus Nomurabacteria bacterium]